MRNVEEIVARYEAEKLQTTAPQRAYLSAARDWAGHGWAEIEERFLSQTRAKSAKAEHLLCTNVFRQLEKKGLLTHEADGPKLTAVGLAYLEMYVP